MRQNVHMKRPSFALLSIAAILAATAACNKQGDYQPVERDKQYDSVISLSPGTTEIIAGNTASRVLSARSAACNYPPMIRNLPVVVENTTPDYEKIVEIQPDLIVYDADLFSDQEIGKLEDLGFETLALDADNMEDYLDFVTRLGSLLGIEATISNYKDKITGTIESANANVNTPLRLTVMLGEVDTALVAGTNSLQSVLIDLAGGIPTGPESNRFEPVNLESLIAMDPEMIITDGNAVEILKDPRLANVSAVKSGFVYNVDGDVLSRRGKRLPQFIESVGTLIETRPVAEVGNE